MFMHARHAVRGSKPFAWLVGTVGGVIAYVGGVIVFVITYGT